MTTITRDHSIQSQINLLMNNFDWEKVMQIFISQDLKYGIFDPDKKQLVDYSPSLEDIQFLVKELMESCVSNPKESGTWSSGLFQVEWNAFEEKLKLQFIPYELEIIHDEPNETIFIA